MMMKKVLVSVLFAAGMIGAVAMPLPSLAEVDVQLNIGPPPMRYEVVPAQRAGYIWAPGYWDYQNSNHTWVEGSHVREREGYSYQPNRWVERDGKWNQERGHWNKRD